jgi:hypothetical protein
VALGHWGTSLAQAIAAEVAERRNQDAEHHGRPSSDQQQQQKRLCNIAQAPHANMTAFEQEGRTALLPNSGNCHQLHQWQTAAQKADLGTHQDGRAHRQAD